MEERMRILVVGDGALGQVFGLRLGLGGAAVNYLVKPGRSGWGGIGRTLYRLRRFGGPVAERLRPEGVHAETPDGSWDMVWLCVSSPALRGSWLPGLRDAVGDATVVTIGQGLHDREVLERVWPAERIVQVVPSLFAYSAPLTGEVPAPGIAYWVPPGSALKVLGDPADQTRLMLDGWIAEGETRAVPVARLRELRNRLSARETA
ncbi:ketopantoate reductase family protein [Nocardia sp. NPDC002869]|uniref:ketopantoate reductase family protein n=1 Tax=Nocardia sp. NPDC002869 TaxID=3161032 RepID=UPI00398C925F